MKYGGLFSTWVIGCGPSSWKATWVMFSPATIASIATWPLIAWPSWTPLKPLMVGPDGATGGAVGAGPAVGCAGAWLAIWKCLVNVPRWLAVSIAVAVSV